MIWAAGLLWTSATAGVSPVSDCWWPNVVPLVAVVTAMSPAEDRAVPVDEEPHHKTVLKNDFVQVFRVTLEPGTTTRTHTHLHDDAAVRLSEATVISDSPGGPAGAPEVVYPGLVSARDNEKKPHTHRVRNIGTTVFDVIDVQILKRPDGPAAPPMTVPAAENPQMRVYRYELGPGGRSDPHTHARPYLLVAATDMNLRMMSPEGESMAHPVKAGDCHWVEAAVTHTLINEGREKGVLVEFELK
jgi:quercetin dioxygenase-like cupin family protein